MFFDCFSRESKKTEKGDTKIGQIGLKKCEEQLNLYKNCMETE